MTTTSTYDPFSFRLTRQRAVRAQLGSRVSPVTDPETRLVAGVQVIEMENAYTDTAEVLPPYVSWIAFNPGGAG